MTILILSLALDCIMSPMIGMWKVGSPAYYSPLLKGCEWGWYGTFQPELISWCNFLGPERCRLEFRDETN